MNFPPAGMEYKAEIIHSLKLRGEFWWRVINGLKNFEVRKNDRDFQSGDYVVFNEVNERGEYISGACSARFKITYVLNGGYGLKEGYVAFGIEKVNE